MYIYLSIINQIFICQLRSLNFEITGKLKGVSIKVLLEVGLPDSSCFYFKYLQIFNLEKAFIFIFFGLKWHVCVECHNFMRELLPDFLMLWQNALKYCLNVAWKFILNEIIILLDVVIMFSINYSTTMCLWFLEKFNMMAASILKWNISV